MPRDFSKEQVLAAIKDSWGIISKIAKNLDHCAWHTAKRYVNIWRETRRAYEDENERALDYSETQMLKQIQDGDGPMIRFHLMTKGKTRGYAERHEITGAEGEPIRIILDA